MKMKLKYTKMERGLSRTHVLVCTLIVVILVLSNSVMTTEAQRSSWCRTQRWVLVTACKPLLARRPPSPYCCQRIRRAPVSCVCPIITPQLAALIDPKFALKVLRSCGRRVPRHFKCGSITLP